MKNTVIIYASNYGFTKQYALYISKQLDCDVFEVKNFDQKSLVNYENVIFGSGVYAGKLNKSNFINKIEDKLDNKNVIIFSVSLTTGRNEDEKNRIQQVFDKSINISHFPKYFSFTGGMDYSKLNAVHSAMMKVAKISMKSKLSKDEYDNFEQNRDLVDFSETTELIDYVKSL
jgi:menaquinone-dependent protoporphyrinogen IX oxidase